ncbi:hypothetical protein [Neptunicella marina]|uniref:Uncharacterized protein n=1 Tax=Neptunicella marina TaxID=2125989 RepID=A0A8J6M0P3_9ALTE|nr:hypothetical protein [Neptunicella marina]MBC3765038.1 hypothetical protein [Neptunicella marina]
MSDTDSIKTHPELAQNFEKIQTLVAAEELDHETLLKLVTERDQLIQQQLGLLSGQSLQLFCQSELDRHHYIQTEVAPLFEQTSKQLAKLMHSRKAIKSYK